MTIILIIIILIIIIMIIIIIIVKIYSNSHTFWSSAVMDPTYTRVIVDQVSPVMP